MTNIFFTFDHTMRELFSYPDPSFPFIVWTGEITSMPNGIMDCHWHNEFEYCVLLSGELNFYIDGQLIHMREGDAVFINSDVLHMAKPVKKVGDAMIFTVSFLSSLFTGGANGKLHKKYFLPILQSSCRGFSVKGENADDCQIIALLNQIYALECSKDEDYELSCLGLISKLWSETLRHIKKHSDIILAISSEQRYEQKTKDAVSFIHEHFAEKICITDITRQTFVSRSELFRSFQRYMNQTPIEYLLEYRLAQAANQLMKTDKSVTQIAIDCGFSGASYFGKAFKNKYGTSPLKFRNQF